jgi:hypothetical protein
MSAFRRLTSTALAVGVLAAVLPASAPAAGTLLSGYGGPGQGSQALLGAGLINGGGGHSGGGGTGTSAEATPQSAAVAQSAEPRTSPARKGHAPRSSGRGGSSARKVSRTPGAGISPAKASNAYPGVSESRTQTVSQDSDPLGVSGADLLYVLVAAAALAFTGLLTRQLTEASGS